MVFDLDIFFSFFFFLVLPPLAAQFLYMGKHWSKINIKKMIQQHLLISLR